MKPPPKTVYWHTGLSVIATLILFVPFVFVCGIFVWVLDFLQQGYLGRTGEGIGVMMRGFQYFLATHWALALPSAFLVAQSRSVVSAIFGTIIAMFVAGGGVFLFLAGSAFPPVWDAGAIRRLYRR